MVVDPLAEKTKSYSIYNYTFNNPILFVDPDGRAAAPIYNEDGEFLGTDDQGLTGKAIVMNDKSFRQGMDHDEALRKNLGVKGLKSDEAKEKLEEHYDGLKLRPDYDGHITLNEANQWYREKGGEPLFADLRKMDLNFIKRDDFSKKDKITYINTLYKSKDGLVYGSIGLSMEQGNIRGYYDDYNFDNKRYTGPPQIPINIIIRNIANGIGNWKAGDGKAFKIHFYGSVPLKN